MEVDDLDDAKKIKEDLMINSEGIITPAFKLPEKWLWLWKIWLVIMFVVFISEIFAFISRII